MQKKRDHVSFSSFAVGATVGAAAALLFGTKEGRAFGQRLLDMIPDSVIDKLPSGHSEDFALPPQPTETEHATEYTPEADVIDTTSTTKPQKL